MSLNANREFSLCKTKGIWGDSGKKITQMWVNERQTAVDKKTEWNGERERNVAIVLQLESCQMRWACVFIKQPQFIWECALSIAFVLCDWFTCWTLYIFNFVFNTLPFHDIRFFSLLLPETGMPQIKWKQQQEQQSGGEKQKRGIKCAKCTYLHWVGVVVYIAQHTIAMVYSTRFILICVNDRDGEWVHLCKQERFDECKCVLCSNLSVAIHN